VTPAPDKHAAPLPFTQAQVEAARAGDGKRVIAQAQKKLAYSTPRRPAPKAKTKARTSRERS
jgi:hypothetical protein